MFDKLKDKLVRFLSIVGGFSSPEDIARAKRRSSPEKEEAAGPSTALRSGRDDRSTYDAGSSSSSSMHSGSDHGDAV